MNDAIVAAAATVILAFALSLYFSPEMPEQMASHWDMAGQVDGYMDKSWGLFLLPLMMAGAGLLMYFLPSIDPLKANIQKFREYYDGFIAILLAFLLFVHIQVVLWNAGIKLNPGSTMPLGLGMLMMYVGILFEKAKRNWFIGIRTPWTLSSDIVWERTHRLGSKLFIAAGVIVLLGSLLPEYSIYPVLIPVLAAALIPAVYSYLEFRKLKR